jgi:two-component sensor histidine kinase
LSSNGISLHLDIDDQYFLLDTAIPFGLILNELMTNSLKYAFSDGRKGIITISLSEKEYGIPVLHYSDNGVGVFDGFDFRNQKSLGLKLIYIIGEQQMMGKVFMENSDGIKCRPKFQKDLYTERV